MNLRPLFLAATLLVLGAPAIAQNGAKPSHDEVAQESAGLKEAYGVISKSIAMLDREIGPDAAAATPAQISERKSLSGILAEVEAMLTAVNTAEAAQWADVKAKSAATRKRALEAAEQRSNR